MSINRAILFITLLLGLTAGVRAADLPWYEPFNYPIGTDLGTNGNAGSRPMSAAEFTRFVDEEMSKWARIVKVSGARAE